MRCEQLPPEAADVNVLTLALSAVGRVSVITSQARFAVRAGGEVTALLAHAAVHTSAVAVALACWETKPGQLLVLSF